MILADPGHDAANIGQDSSVIADAGFAVGCEQIALGSDVDQNPPSS